LNLKPGTYIAIEGAIGSGKSSLARIVAEEFGAQLILEEADSNPYLKDFYRDPRRYALQVQLNFLLSRHRQQMDIKQINIFQQAIVTDYLYEKDRIFAHLNLDERELELYNRVSDLLSGETPKPDLVVYLQSSADRLLTNIKVRERDYEEAITLDYLQQLCELYHQFFFRWDATSLLILNSTRLDFVNNPEHRQSLLNAIVRMPAGTTYFNPEV
jgi:deoxyadenosine/deoxycytidine kinase